MNHSEEKSKRWTWPTILSVAVMVLLCVAALMAILGVLFGWIDPPPDPEGTYPDRF